MAEEIWTQTDGQIDGSVQSVGTAASLRCTGEALRRRNEQIRIVAVEPSESPVLSLGQPGAHKRAISYLIGWANVPRLFAANICPCCNA